MIIGSRVEGVEKAIAKINAIKKTKKSGSLAGLIDAGLFLQGEAQKKAPIKFGNLRASAYTVWRGGGG